MVSNWIPGNSIQLVKNPFYWDAQNIRVPHIRYLTGLSDIAELTLYRANELDITSTIPPSEFGILKTRWKNEVHVSPFLGTCYLALNMRTTSALTSKKEVREALSLAVDRDTLQSTFLTFGQQPAYSFVAPGTKRYKQQVPEWHAWSKARRIAQAQRLLAAAVGSHPEKVRIRLLVSNSGSIKRLAVLVAGMWSENLGISTEIIDEEFRVFLDSRRDTKKWDVARLGWTADFNDATSFLNTFRSTSINNDSGYVNINYDKLLDRATDATDEMSREEFLENAERMMLDEYPIVPLYFYSSKRLIKPYVRGARVNALDRMYSKFLTLSKN
jgi:oligopeptide transport system substrate-binding protein